MNYPYMRIFHDTPPSSRRPRTRSCPQTQGKPSTCRATTPPTRCYASGRPRTSAAAPPSSRRPRTRSCPATQGRLSTSPATTPPTRWFPSGRRRSFAQPPKVRLAVNILPTQPPKFRLSLLEYLYISWNTGPQRPFGDAISLIEFTHGPIWSCL